MTSKLRSTGTAGRCAFSHKITFTRYETAAAAAHSLDGRAYSCPSCVGYHITRYTVAEQQQRIADRAVQDRVVDCVEPDHGHHDETGARFRCPSCRQPTHWSAQLDWFEHDALTRNCEFAHDPERSCGG